MILVISIISVAFVGWDRWTNIEVYFDNGLDRTVKLDLDGKQFDLGRNSTHKEEMQEGRHTVIVRGADAKEIERLTFDLQKMSPFDATATSVGASNSSVPGPATPFFPSVINMLPF